MAIEHKYFDDTGEASDLKKILAFLNQSGIKIISITRDDNNEGYDIFFAKGVDNDIGDKVILARLDDIMNRVNQIENRLGVTAKDKKKSEYDLY